MPNQYEHLQINKQSGITTVFLNRDDDKNALNESLIIELTDFSRKIRKDLETRVVVFNAKGKNFSVGHDLKDVDDHQHLFERWKHRVGSDLIESILNIEQITICSLKGFCLGGGAVIASACDFRIASLDTQVGYPEINLGMNLSWAGLPLAISLVGVSKAKQMVIGGDLYEVNNLLNWGFIDEIFDPADESACLDKWCEKYKSKSPLAVQMIKRSTNEVALSVAKTIMHSDYDQLLLTTYSEEQIKAIDDFRQKKNKSSIGSA